MTLPESVWERASSLDGWLSRAEAELLFWLCEPVWLEIGSFVGRSATVLAAKGAGVCVDSFREHGSSADLLRENLPSNVTVIDSDFRKCVGRVPDGLGFLHLDADHSYAATNAAFDLYVPKLRPGGFVVIHDAWVFDVDYNPWPEVTEFVRDVVAEPEGFGVEHVVDVERSAAFRKL